MFPGNGVQRDLRNFFSCLVPNQQQHVYTPHSIKETAGTMGPSKVVYKSVRCSSVYATIEDIRRHDCRKSFIVTEHIHMSMMTL